MFISFRVRRYVGWICAGTLALFILLVVLHRSISSVSSDRSEGVSVPIIMYHSILKSAKGTYEVTPARLESDLQYLTSHGYTTVVIQDLIDYVNGTGSLPEKPIILTFDDGNYNNYEYAFPLMKQYHCKMVVAPIGTVTEEHSQADIQNITWGHLRWVDLQEMVNSGLVEVQNHSYDLHVYANGQKGSMKKKGETDQQYQDRLCADLEQMQTAVKQHIGITPTAFVYPFGAISYAAQSAIEQMGFSATLTCEERMNIITRDPACLYGLGRYLRTEKIDSETFFAGLT